ncbi:MULTISPECIES: hypothetical protein [unclassified Microbacterium]|uniref:hypothetical protein n=1 Tax=unclassified Microbacterium TaxID=2609290 RepID=UPI0012FAF6EA|nr:hypothetical protein [Microbacterium sp. MAH-37]MVQ41438.1 hypothetical protein [Microbacterium sp. MAH-37]
MPATESRPFRVPAQHSVRSHIRCLSPAVDLEEIADTWEPGQDLVFQITSELSPEFWVETGISPSEEVTLVGTVTCLAARTRWRGSASFVPLDGQWVAAVEVEVDGSAVAVEVLIDISVVGPGRTGHPDPALATHRSARLWSIPSPVRVPFERLGEVFPTSAVSFSATGRRRIPWSVDVAHDAEPAWGLTSAVRLYVNTDLQAGERILEGDADQSVYKAIQADIVSAVLIHLASVRDGYSTASITESAEADVSSFAAFCTHVAATLGFDIEIALRLAIEEPMQLIERAREASGFMAEED